MRTVLTPPLVRVAFGSENASVALFAYLSLCSDHSNNSDSSILPQRARPAKRERSEGISNDSVLSLRQLAGALVRRHAQDCSLAAARAFLLLRPRPAVF